MEAITKMNSKEKLQSLIAIDFYNDVNADTESLILKNEYIGKIVQKIKDKDPVKYLILGKENSKLITSIKNSLLSSVSDINDCSVTFTCSPSEFLVGLGAELISIHYYNESIRKIGPSDLGKSQMLLVSNEYKQEVFEFAVASFPQLTQYANIKVSSLDFLMVNIETVYQLLNKGKLAGLFATKSKQELASVMPKDVLVSPKFRLVQLNTINLIKQKNRSEIRFSLLRDTIKKQINESNYKEIILDIKDKIKGNTKDILDLIELTLIKQTASFLFQSSMDPSDQSLESAIKSASSLHELDVLSNFFFIEPAPQTKKIYQQPKEVEPSIQQISKPIKFVQTQEDPHRFSSTINQSNLAKYRFFIQNSTIISNFVKKAIIRVLGSLNISKFNLFPSSVKNIKNYMANLIQEHEFSYICKNLNNPDLPNGETNTLLEVFIDGIVIEFINIGLISIIEKTKIKYDLRKIETKRVELNII